MKTVKELQDGIREAVRELHAEASCAAGAIRILESLLDEPAAELPVETDCAGCGGQVLGTPINVPSSDGYETFPCCSEECAESIRTGGGAIEPHDPHCTCNDCVHDFYAALEQRQDG